MENIYLVSQIANFIRFLLSVGLLAWLFSDLVKEIRERRAASHLKPR